jgi:hypothetical protein
MTQLAHLPNINFSTGFETDKTCAVLANSYLASSYNTVLGGFLYQKNIPHSFGRPVFCDALFSTDGSTYFPSGSNNATTSILAYSDASNIYILSTSNTGTVYYKIVCTWIDNYDNSNPLITPVFQNSLYTTYATKSFDSRQNYQKILFNNMVTRNNPGVGGATLPVAHNLGYIPNYKIFFESLPNQIWPAISGGVSDVWLYSNSQYETYGVIDSANLNITYTPGSTGASTVRIWYKIYDS